MASRYEVEVTITSAKDLKNVNWRYGPLKPYTVVWVDPKAKSSTRVDESGDKCPFWDETLVIPLNNYSIEDSTLHVDIVHAVAPEEDTKPLIGMARLPVREVLDEAGFGRSVFRKLDLRRPSGRPHGKLELKVSVREPRYRNPDPYYAPPYGVPPPAGSRDYSAPQQYGYPYAAQPPPQGQYQAAPPPSDYQYGAPAPPYGQPAYAGQPAAYGQSSYGYAEEKKKSKFGGMGTGLAVGAVAGVLGGLALAEGADYIEDKITDHVADKVEDDLGYGGDGDGDGDGDFDF